MINENVLRVLNVVYYALTSVTVRLSVSVCRVPRPNSRMERPRKPKIGTMEAHHTSNP